MAAMDVEMAVGPFVTALVLTGATWCVFDEVQPMSTRRKATSIQLD